MDILHGDHFFNRQIFSRRDQVAEGERHWGWFMGMGILFVLLGTIGLGMVVLMTVASVLAFGALLLVAGGFQIAHAFSVPGWKAKSLYLLMGLVYLFTSLLMISNPILGSAVLTLMLASAFIMLGVFRMVFAFQHRVRHRWIWPMIAGALSVILGFVILFQWPISGLWVIGLLVSLEMIFHGWAAIALSLVEKEGTAP